jgi:hypothetical protein
MSVVNTDGLTLFGSGSEWFWSMLQFLVVAVTLIAIYVQLRQGRAANAFSQASSLRQEWYDELMTRRKLALFLALHDDAPDAEVVTLAEPISDFWEHVGGLVRAGHVSLPLVYYYLGSACQTTWNILEPQVRDVQATQGAAIWEDFAWLAAQCARLRETGGKGDGSMTRETFRERAPEIVASLRRSIADFEATRAVMAPPSPPAAGPPAPLPEAPAPSRE